MSTPKLIFGGGALVPDLGYRSAEDVSSLLDVIDECGIKEIDTSALYGESEKYLGDSKAPSRFLIDTKLAGGGSPVPSTKDIVVAQGKESLGKLGTSQVKVYFIHGPDPRVPLEEMLAGIDELYQAGSFQRFGLSNYDPEGVEDVIRVCKEHNFVLPTVYQGNYNAVARRTETELIPLLRQHNIAFYAYSPIAGGFLAKTSADLKSRTLSGRWAPESFFGGVYYELYAGKSAFLDALDAWHEIAAAEGVSGWELAYRWIVHSSILDGRLGDAVVIGPRTAEQLQEVMEAIRKGPLTNEAQTKVAALWEPLKGEAYLDNLDAIKNLMAHAGTAA